MRPRARDLGIKVGDLECGNKNFITDVCGVMVGHSSYCGSSGEKSGVTAIIPHADNVYDSRVPAGLFVGNGHGKFIGSTQLKEMGEIETPILLTNTLATPEAAAALIEYTLERATMTPVRSVNPIVGETNDSTLNAIAERPLSKAMMHDALQAATPDTVVEGCIGAGSGIIAFGWKSGIGSSSRLVRTCGATYTLGCLVQPNFDGRLRISGIPISRLSALAPLQEAGLDGSIMIVLATDAPLSDRNLERLAFRAICGMAVTGASMANNSGDYAIAFSNAPSVRRSHSEVSRREVEELPNVAMSSLFQAAIDATEEAIYNALFSATDVRIPPTLPNAGTWVRALPMTEITPLLSAGL